MSEELVFGGEEKIKRLIYEIRGKQVMLDSDLAGLYGCKNGAKTINQAVNRHKSRFPEDFCFQLSESELLRLRSQIVTSNEECDFLRSQVGTAKLNNKSRVRPTVFTEQGVAMLATILRTEVASRVSVAIMRAFVAMRCYFDNNNYRLSNIETKIIEHDQNIKLLQESFQQFGEKRKYNEIYFDGQIYDAYSKIKEIFEKAKKELIIIDAYADNTTLNLVKGLEINVIIITGTKSLLTKQDISKYNAQYHNLIIIYNDSFHDRYFVLDEKSVYHCGASINRVGHKTFSINLVGDEEVRRLLIERIRQIKEA